MNERALNSHPNVFEIIKSLFPLKRNNKKRAQLNILHLIHVLRLGWCSYEGQLVVHLVLDALVDGLVGLVGNGLVVETDLGHVEDVLEFLQLGLVRLVVLGLAPLDDLVGLLVVQGIVVQVQQNKAAWKMLSEVRGKGHQFVATEVQVHEGRHGFQEFNLDAVYAVVGQVQVEKLRGVLEPGGLEDRQLVPREDQTFEFLETWK